MNDARKIRNEVLEADARMLELTAREWEGTYGSGGAARGIALLLRTKAAAIRAIKEPEE